MSLRFKDNDQRPVLAEAIANLTDTSNGRMRTVIQSRHAILWRRTPERNSDPADFPGSYPAALGERVLGWSHGWFGRSRWGSCLVQLR